MKKYQEWTFEVHESLSSTSDRCFDYLSSEKDGIIAVIAHHQTSGRGTHNRQWQTPAGNLAFSFTLRSNSPLDCFSFRFSESQQFIQALPYIMALSVFEVIRELLLPDQRSLLSIKWPNDILWKGKKISGILIESSFSADVANIVIGIGMNVCSSPKISGRSLTSIKEIGAVPIPVIDLAKKILSESKNWFSCWKVGRFPAIRREWLSRTCSLGTILEMGTGKSRMRGAFMGITDAGHLMLKDCNGKVISFVTTEIR
ncbi:biotin--[acetyl-CoA-carboxylase] ligase [Acetobacteraceae bacterium]|nr:biotin--[acetyl-CoA-carboxylase] ligase [Acetobacteraceae bacterium]